MNRRFLPFVVGLVAGLLPVAAQDPALSVPSVNAAGPVPSESRHLALEAIRPLAGEGFRIREGEWSVAMTGGERRFLRVTLFAGERYLFAAAATAQGGEPKLMLFDASGKEVKSGPPKGWDPAASGKKTASVAEVAPGKSGAYFVSVEIIGGPATGPCDFSLVYAYK